MMRKMLMFVGTVAIATMSSSALAGDCSGCAKFEKAKTGYCQGCHKGKAFGVEMKSHKLYAALAGHSMKKDDVKCSGCKTALANDGECAHCKTFAAKGKMYHSSVAAALAKGKPYSAKKAEHCAGCAKAYKENGFCTGCDTGFVAGSLFQGRKMFDAALAAYKTLKKAVHVAEKCEGCATAMVTDGECAHCKKQFKNGEAKG